MPTKTKDLWPRTVDDTQTSVVAFATSPGPKVFGVESIEPVFGVVGSTNKSLTANNHGVFSVFLPFGVEGLPMTTAHYRWLPPSAVFWRSAQLFVLHLRDL